jgi:2-keto-4-pentenoate hydratase/2-oxohepta-3-ene-1,7-dioic acid hydratase in catechol pathway
MKIICIGRNYQDHAKELNNPIPEKPLFFLKPDSSIIKTGKPFFIPSFSDEIHYELELVIRINRLGKHIQPKFAHKYFSEIGLGIDFTARDIQRECKKNGHPWEIAKSFDGSAIIGQFCPISDLNENNIGFHLTKNNKTVQTGQSKDMIFSFNEIISYISKFMTLKIGDLIFTGTPAGVGKVQIGDTLRGYIEENEMLRTPIR